MFREHPVMVFTPFITAANTVRCFTREPLFVAGGPVRSVVVRGRWTGAQRSSAW